MNALPAVGRQVVLLCTYPDLRQWDRSRDYPHVGAVPGRRVCRTFASPLVSGSAAGVGFQRRSRQQANRNFCALTAAANRLNVKLSSGYCESGNSRKVNVGSETSRSVIIGVDPF